MIRDYTNLLSRSTRWVELYTALPINTKNHIFLILKLGPFFERVFSGKEAPSNPNIFYQVFLNPKDQELGKLKIQKLFKDLPDLKRVVIALNNLKAEDSYLLKIQGKEVMYLSVEVLYQYFYRSLLFETDHYIENTLFIISPDFTLVDLKFVATLFYAKLNGGSKEKRGYLDEQKFKLSLILNSLGFNSKEITESYWLLSEYKIYITYNSSIMTLNKKIHKEEDFLFEPYKEGLLKELENKPWRSAMISEKLWDYILPLMTQHEAEKIEKLLPLRREILETRKELLELRKYFFEKETRDQELF